MKSHDFFMSANQEKSKSNKSKKKKKQPWGLGQKKENYH